MSPDYEFSSELVLWGGIRTSCWQYIWCNIAQILSSKWTANSYVMHTYVHRISFQTNLKNFSAQHFLIVFVFWIRCALIYMVCPPSRSIKSATHYEINNKFLTSHIWLQHIKTILHFLDKSITYLYFIWQTLKLYVRVFREVAAECLCFAKTVYVWIYLAFYMFGCVSDNKF